MTSARKYTVNDFLSLIPATVIRDYFPLPADVNQKALDEISVNATSPILPPLVYISPLLATPALMEKISHSELIIAQTPFLYKHKPPTTPQQLFPHKTKSTPNPSKVGFGLLSSKGVDKSLSFGTNLDLNDTSKETTIVTATPEEEEKFIEEFRKGTSLKLFDLWEYSGNDRYPRGPFPAKDMHEWTIGGYFNSESIYICPKGPGAPNFFMQMAKWKALYNNRTPWDPELKIEQFSLEPSVVQSIITTIDQDVSPNTKIITEEETPTPSHQSTSVVESQNVVVFNMRLGTSKTRQSSWVGMAENIIKDLNTTNKTNKKKTETNEDNMAEKISQLNIETTNKLDSNAVDISEFVVDDKTLQTKYSKPITIKVDHNQSLIMNGKSKKSDDSKNIESKTIWKITNPESATKNENVPEASNRGASNAWETNLTTSNLETPTMKTEKGTDDKKTGVVLDGSINLDQSSLGLLKETRPTKDLKCIKENRPIKGSKLPKEARIKNVTKTTKSNSRNIINHPEKVSVTNTTIVETVASKKLKNEKSPIIQDLESGSKSINAENNINADEEKNNNELPKTPTPLVSPCNPWFPKDYKPMAKPTISPSTTTVPKTVKNTSVKTAISTMNSWEQISSSFKVGLTYKPTSTSANQPMAGADTASSLKKDVPSTLITEKQLQSNSLPRSQSRFTIVKSMRGNSKKSDKKRKESSLDPDEINRLVKNRIRPQQIDWLKKELSSSDIDKFEVDYNVLVDWLETLPNEDMITIISSYRCPNPNMIISSFKKHSNFLRSTVTNSIIKEQGLNPSDYNTNIIDEDGFSVISKNIRKLPNNWI